MAAITSILIGAAVVAGVGAGAAVYQSNQAKKRAAAQKRAIDAQTAQARTEAANKNALAKTADDTGATVKLGSQQDKGRGGTVAQRSGSGRTGTTSGVGGLGASKKLGL